MTLGSSHLQVGVPMPSNNLELPRYIDGSIMFLVELHYCKVGIPIYFQLQYKYFEIITHMFWVYSSLAGYLLVPPSFAPDPLIKPNISRKEGVYLYENGHNSS
jgi:hypothetical protein